MNSNSVLELLNLVVSKEPDALHKVLQKCCELLNAQISTICKIDGNQFTVEEIYSTDSGEEGKGTSGPTTESYCDITLNKNALTAIPSFAESSYQDFKPYQTYKIEGYLSIPFNVTDKLYGVLSFFYYQPQLPFSQETKNLVEHLANILSKVIEDKIEKQSNEIIASAINKSNDAIFLTAADASFRFVNDKACDLLGYSRQELLSKTVLDIDNVVEPEFLFEHFNKVHKEGYAIFETEQVSKTGKVIPVEIRENPVVIDGELFIQSHVIEITNRIKRREQEKMSRLSRLSIQNSSDSIFWINKDGSFYYVNETAQNKLGYSKTEILKLGITDIAPEVKSKSWNKHYDKIKNSSSIIFESIHKTKSDLEYPVEVRASYIEFEGEEYVYALVTDITDKIESQKLEKLNTFISSSISNSTESVFFIMRDGSFGYVNEPACKKLEYTYDELCSGGLHLINPSFTNDGFATYFDSLKDGELSVLETYHKTKSGKVFPIQATSTYFELDGQEYLRSHVVDITEKREQEQKYKDIYSKTPAMMYTTDRDGKLVQVSDYLCEKLGYAKDELLGCASTDFITLESKSYAVKVGIPELAKNNYCENVPYEFVTKAGDKLDVLMSATVIRTSEGYFKEALGVITDITKYKTLESKQLEVAERERVLLKAIPDMMVRLDGSGTFIDYHANIESNLYLKPEDFIGKNCYKVWPKYLADFHMKYVGKALDTGEVQVYEYEMETQRGEIKHFESRCLANGKNEVISIIRDITERKKEQEELNKSNKEIEQYAYIATHDLKAPLINIQGHFDYVKNAVVKTDEETKESIYWVEESIKQAQKKIESLVEVAKVRRAGKGVSEQLDLNKIVTSVIDLHNIQIAEKNIDVKIDIPNGIFYGVNSKITSILQNIVSNSIKYSDLSKPNPYVKIILSKTFYEDVILIEDNGIGMDFKDNKLKIFNMFTRFHDKEEGQGIGLYLVKKMIEQEKGYIRVKSRKGIGTKVFIAFPKNTESLFVNE